MNLHKGREPLSSLDAVWLQLESATQPMGIIVVLRFDRKFPMKVLLSLVQDRLLQHKKFRSKVNLSHLRPGWDPIANFDFRYHVHRKALRKSDDLLSLWDFVSDLASKHFDRMQPLWQIYLVDHKAGGSTVILHLHHALADGLALVRLFLTFTDEGLSALPPLVGLTRSDQDVSLLAKAKKSIDQCKALGHLVFLPADPPSVFKGDPGRRKRIAWSGALSIIPLKDIASQTQATVNDVLVGLTAGAIRVYLNKRLHQTRHDEIRAIVPVAYHDPSQTEGLGNHFGLVFVPLPLSFVEPLDGIRAARQRLDAIKNSQETQVAMSIMGLMGANATLAGMARNFFAQKATMLMTNVPGPRTPIHLAGIPLADLIVFAPTSGSIGLGLSFISYAGILRLGVYADAGVVADPENIVRAFEDEYKNITAGFGTPSISPKRTV